MNDFYNSERYRIFFSSVFHAWLLCFYFFHWSINEFLKLNELLLLIIMLFVSHVSFVIFIILLPGNANQSSYYWTVSLLIAYFGPPTLPVKKKTMNYVSLLSWWGLLFVSIGSNDNRQRNVGVFQCKIAMGLQKKQMLTIWENALARLAYFVDEDIFSFPLFLSI